MQWNDRVLEQLRERGVAVVPQWLSEVSVAQLQVLYQELPFAPARVGQAENLSVRPELRGDSTAWINHLSPPDQLVMPLAQLEDLRVRCNRELFLGLVDRELHLAKYPAGAFYKTHRDRHERSSRRVLSVILYLNQDWLESDGGELVLYNSELEEQQRVLPRGGTLVSFISADFPHEVLPARRERRSLTGWLLEGGSDVSAV